MYLSTLSITASDSSICVEFLKTFQVVLATIFCDVDQITHDRFLNVMHIAVKLFPVAV